MDRPVRVDPRPPRGTDRDLTTGLFPAWRRSYLTTSRHRISIGANHPASLTDHPWSGWNRI